MIKFNKTILSSILLLFVLFFSCTNRDETNKRLDDISFGALDTIPYVNLTSEEDVIFYSIFSPIDANQAWNGVSHQYHSNLLNPLNNITKYQSSDKVALNLGVYGTDLSYLWLFNQSQQGLSYLSAVQRLSGQLGIPNEFVKLTAEAAESNLQQTDSLITLARAAYLYMDEHLKSSDRAHSANLIMLGGWIESLFIATNMYDEPDEKLASKIATQKFSLNSLINILENDQNDVAIKEYLLLLNNLKEAFDRFEIHFDPNNIEIDTLNKRITIKKDELINLDAKNFKEIKNKTSQIRKHIIS